MKEYELMHIIEHDVSDRYPNGIDSESVAAGGAFGIIKYLLKHDTNVKGYKLVKTEKAKPKTFKVLQPKGL